MTDDDDLLRSDIESRAAALNVERSAIVQAPAGSGKTELLIQRYLRLLAVVARPEEILAITFTRKAACEMQNRVSDALRTAKTGVEPDTDYQRTTYRAARAALVRDKQLDWNLIEFPGRMRIQTVDSFGAGVARALPLSSGLGGIGATVTGAEMNELYGAAAAATLDSLRYDSAYGAAVERVLTHLDNRVRLYVSHLSRMLAYRDQWLAITGGGLPDSADNAEAVRRGLETHIAGLVASSLQRLRDLATPGSEQRLLTLIRYAAENLQAGENPEHPFCAFGDTMQIADDVDEARRTWQAIATLLLTKGGEWRKTINKNEGFPPGNKVRKQELLDLIAELRTVPLFLANLQRARALPPARYVDDQWDVLLALLRLLPLAVVELQRLFGERGVCDHIEVALAASSALGTDDEPGDIALALDYRIRHLLVDEMQDTSISQYGLLTRLTAGWTPDDGRTLFCVGDPMQSIYRFRDAEVGQFLLARDAGIGDVALDSLLLRRNFRSGEHLVHWFNTVFSQVFPLRDDLSAGAISYSASVPVEAHANSGECRIHPLFGKTAEEEAEYSLSVIRDCLAEHADDKVAVLVRSRTNLPALLRALRLANIEYEALEIDRLTDLPEIIDLLALTRALCHEADRLAWLALLRGPCVGLTWSDLHALVRNDDRRTVPELLADPERLASLSPNAAERVADFRTRLLKSHRSERSQTLRDRVEAAWYALGGPCLMRDRDQVDNAHRFLDVIEKIEVAGSLDDVRELEVVLDQERVSTTGGPDSRVQIMTMHKAKGLQFDHVVLHGLGRMTRSSDKSVLSWTSGAHAGGGMILSPIGPQSEMDNDPLHQFIEGIERDKEQFELDRLLYVSCTRAIKSLHLVGSVGLAADGESFRRPAATTLLARLWPAIEHTYVDAFGAGDATDAAGEPDEEPPTLIRTPLRRLRVGPPCDAPELPSPAAGAAQPGMASGAHVTYEWVGATARHAGTLIHRWLQYISEGRVDPDREGVAGAAAITRHWAEVLGVANEDLDEVGERVAAALQNVSSDEKARWLLHGPGETEYPVSGVFEGSVQSIVIDRVRIDDETGVHWIVDYKTGTHEGGDLDGFLRQEIERHRPQLEKYALLYRNLCGAEVRAALYFPLLRKYCEVRLPVPA